MSFLLLTEYFFYLFEDMSLDERKVSILDDNAIFLKENIDCENGLLEYMVRIGALTERQVDSIHTHPNACDRSEALLGIIRRGNRRQYDMTAEALIALNQRDVANVLIRGGGKHVLFII